MPTAPLLPPDQMAQAQGSAGINPANFLIAAADLHGQGALRSVVPQGQDPVANAFRRPRKRQPDIKVVR